MVFYICLLLLLSFLIFYGYLNAGKEEISGFVVLVIIVLISGLRYRVGGDYDSYVSWYLNGNRDGDIELGYLMIMKLFRWFDLSPSFLFFFFSFFTYLFVYLGLRKFTTNSNISLLFYILIPSMFLTSLVLVRQSFSVAISFYALYYLINRKYVVFSILMLVGISIHYTCVLPLFFYLFLVKFVDLIKVKHLVYLLIISIILSMFDFVYFFENFFKQTRYSYYFYNERIPVNFFKIFVLNCISIFILFYFDKIKRINPYKKYILILYFFSVVLINILSPFNDLSRLYIYFRIFEVIVVADLIIQENKNYRLIIFSFFYILYFGSFINALNIDFTSKEIGVSQFIPYNCIIETLR